MKKKDYLKLVLPGLEKIVIENPSENILYCESDDHQVDIFGLPDLYSLIMDRSMMSRQKKDRKLLPDANSLSRIVLSSGTI